MKRLLHMFVLGFLILVLTVFPAEAASDQAGQCEPGLDKWDYPEDFEDGTITVDGFELTVTVSGGTVTFSGPGIESVDFCIKAGSANQEGPQYFEGVLTGTHPRGSVSNIVVYRVTGSPVEPPVEPPVVYPPVPEPPVEPPAPPVDPPVEPPVEPTPEPTPEPEPEPAPDLPVDDVPDMPIDEPELLEQGVPVTLPQTGVPALLLAILGLALTGSGWYTVRRTK